MTSHITNIVVNISADETDDYCTTELKAITDHGYWAGILELQVEYTDGTQSWYSINSMRDK